MNFAYVRSLILLILASLAGLASAPETGSAAVQPPPRDGPVVTVALLPQDTGFAGLRSVEGLSPGLLSAGIGSVPAGQTYLDLTQGNRTSDSLYPRDLPLLRPGPGGVAPRAWEKVSRRAADAPADIRPGLLGSTLEDAGLAALADRRAGLGRLIAVDEEGSIAALGDRRCTRGDCAGLTVVAAGPAELERLVAAVGGRDLLIAIERPPPHVLTLSIGVAGTGFDGLLTSESTRTEGLVASTDVAPTILEHLGVAVPPEMNGQPIRASGERELGALVDLRDRLEVTGERRGPVVGQTLLVWLALAGLAVAVGGRRVAPGVVSLLALAVIYLPLVLLLSPLAEPSLPAERLIGGLGPPLLAVATLRLFRGWAGLALACLVTVAAYAIDVAAGSLLVPLSIPGPNPASGSRFYGIGNELEATVAVLLPVGLGALLAALPATRDGGRAAALAFLATGLAAGAVFALGRFGADVGAAIVLPVGGAAAAAIVLRRRRAALLVLALPVLALAALMAADVLGGGEAHLTRSVLDAGGLDEVGDVFERRVQLAARSFSRGANLPFLAVTVAVAGLAVWRRGTVLGWFRPRAALAGFGGGVAATVVGSVSNDSGAALLILGCGFCVAAAGYAWALRAGSWEGAGHAGAPPTLR